MTRPAHGNAPAVGANRPGGPNPTQTVFSSTGRKFLMSIPQTPEQGKVPAAVRAWFAITQGETSVPRETPDPVLAARPAPAWASFTDFTASAYECDRVYTGETAHFVTSLADGCETLVDGQLRVTMATAGVTLEQPVAHREATVVLSSYVYGNDPIGEYAELLRLRIAEARQLAAALTAAVDVAEVDLMQQAPRQAADLDATASPFIEGLWDLVAASKAEADAEAAFEAALKAGDGDTAARLRGELLAAEAHRISVFDIAAAHETSTSATAPVVLDLDKVMCDSISEFGSTVTDLTQFDQALDQVVNVSRNYGATEEAIEMTADDDELADHHRMHAEQKRRSAVAIETVRTIARDLAGGAQ